MKKDISIMIIVWSIYEKSHFILIDWFGVMLKIYTGKRLICIQCCLATQSKNTHFFK